jgi:hypothetical protein
MVSRFVSSYVLLLVFTSIGAGGKGGSSRTYAIDRDAAQHFITASARTPSVRKFLLVSYIGSRRNRAPWWDDDDWTACQEVNTKTLPHYFAAKVEADECLLSLGQQRRAGGQPFQDICLRPGTLTDDPPTGKVTLGHTRARGKVSRADVADVAVKLLERDDIRGYVDLLEGNEDVTSAIDRVSKEKIDCVEGEDVGTIAQKFKL